MRFLFGRRHGSRSREAVLDLSGCRGDFSTPNLPQTASCGEIGWESDIFQPLTAMSGGTARSKKLSLSEPQAHHMKPGEELSPNKHKRDDLTLFKAPKRSTFPACETMSTSDAAVSKNTVMVTRSGSNISMPTFQLRHKPYQTIRVVEIGLVSAPPALDILRPTAVESIRDEAIMAGVLTLCSAITAHLIAGDLLALSAQLSWCAGLGKSFAFSVLIYMAWRLRLMQLLQVPAAWLSDWKVDWSRMLEWLRGEHGCAACSSKVRFAASSPVCVRELPDMAATLEPTPLQNNVEHCATAPGRWAAYQLDTYPSEGADTDGSLEVPSEGRARHVA